METENSSQTAKNFFDLLKRNFRLVKKWFFFSRTVNIIFLILLFALVIIGFIFKIKITPSEQAYYYFFSSVAQSMAAIIALAGSIGVFSYSTIYDKLKRLKQLTREKFQTNEWAPRFSATDSLTWNDNEVIEKAKSSYSTRLPPDINNVLAGLIKEMETQKKSLDEYIEKALPSLMSTSFSFFSSLILLPFSLKMAEIKWGSFFITLILFTIIISLRNIYVFFKSTLIK